MATGLNRFQEREMSYLKSLKAFTTGKSISAFSLNEKKNDEIGGLQARNLGEEDKLIIPSFPLTPTMCVMSLVFWTCIGVFLFYGVTYGLILARITDEADLNGPCLDVFQSNRNENLKRVKDYNIGEALPYLLRLRPHQKPDYPVETKMLPVLLTAITSAQFYQVQGLIWQLQEDILPDHPDLKLIVYDLGLYSSERRLMQQFCQCELRLFPYELFPRHVARISSFAWRPIMIQLVLEEFGAAVYVDPTTRFKTKASLNFLRMRGTHAYFVWDPPAYTSLVGYTDLGMFQYFNESRCTFLSCGLLTSEAIAVYRTDAAWTEFMKPWLACALNEDCIAPSSARYTGCIELRHPRTTGCHRYDMSALSIILNRGVQYTLNSEHLVLSRLTYTDLEEVMYFPEQPWTNGHIFFIVILPFLFVFVYKCVYRTRRCYSIRIC